MEERWLEHQPDAHIEGGRLAPADTMAAGSSKAAREDQDQILVVGFAVVTVAAT